MALKPHGTSLRAGFAEVSQIHVRSDQLQDAEHGETGDPDDNGVIVVKRTN